MKLKAKNWLRHSSQIQQPATMWCKKRITNQDLLIRFGDGRHRFYIESVCANPTDSDLCNYCANLHSQLKTQDVKTFPHGLVTNEYPIESHIFDSPWYHSKVKAYGEPSKEDIVLAMEAQHCARMGKKTKSIKDLLEFLAEKESEELPKSEPESEKKVRKKRIDKSSIEKEIKSEIKSTIDPKTVKFIETTDDPIEIQEVSQFSLKKIIINKDTFWYDSESRRIYERINGILKYKRDMEEEEEEDCV
jgi:hypothetical protein